MIRFDDVVVRYPRAAADALCGVSLEATRGVLTAIVGPNGSGKSTLVRALIGRIGLTRGSMWVEGVAVASHGPRRAGAHGWPWSRSERSSRSRWRCRSTSRSDAFRIWAFGTRRERKIAPP